MASYNHLFKILLVGDSGVGKTSILTRFAQEKFDTDVSNTIGVDLMVKMMEFRDQTIKLTIWVCSLFAFAVILLTLQSGREGFIMSTLCSCYRGLIRNQLYYLLFFIASHFVFLFLLLTIGYRYVGAHP